MIMMMTTKGTEIDGALGRMNATILLRPSEWQGFSCLLSPRARTLTLYRNVRSELVVMNNKTQISRIRRLTQSKQTPSDE